MSDHDAGIISPIGDGSVTEVTSKQRATISPPIECSSLVDLQNHLRQVLKQTSLAFIPLLMATDLYLNSNATFKFNSTFVGIPESMDPCSEPERWGRHRFRVERLQRASYSMTELLKETDDPKSRIRLQAFVARQVVEAIEDVDGFRYGVQSGFDSKKNGHRFTFVCHDSVWNRERRRRARNLGELQEGSKSRCGSTWPTCMVTSDS